MANTQLEKMRLFLVSGKKDQRLSTQDPIQGLIALRNTNVAHGRAGFEGLPGK